MQQYVVYRIAQNGGRKLWQIVANKHLGGQNIGRLAALHSKIARNKIVWQISREPPNLPKLSTTKVLCYTAYSVHIYWQNGNCFSLKQTFKF